MKNIYISRHKTESGRAIWESRQNDFDRSKRFIEHLRQVRESGFIPERIMGKITDSNAIFLHPEMVQKLCLSHPERKKITIKETKVGKLDRAMRSFKTKYVIKLPKVPKSENIPLDVITPFLFFNNIVTFPLLGLFFDNYIEQIGRDPTRFVNNLLSYYGMYRPYGANLDFTFHAYEDVFLFRYPQPKEKIDIHEVTQQVLYDVQNKLNVNFLVWTSESANQITNHFMNEDYSKIKQIALPRHIRIKDVHYHLLLCRSKKFWYLPPSNLKSEEFSKIWQYLPEGFFRDFSALTEIIRAEFPHFKIETIDELISLRNSKSSELLRKCFHSMTEEINSNPFSNEFKIDVVRKYKEKIYLFIDEMSDEFKDYIEGKATIKAVSAIGLDLLGMIPLVSPIFGGIDTIKDFGELIRTREIESELRKWGWMLFFTEISRKDKKISA